MSRGVVHCMAAPYDRYVGRGNDPQTGEPGEWGNLSRTGPAGSPA